MKVTAAGIEGEIDAFRSGEYKLKMSIRDSQKRTGRKTPKFIVAD